MVSTLTLLRLVLSFWLLPLQITIFVLTLLFRLRIPFKTIGEKNIIILTPPQLFILHFGLFLVLIIIAGVESNTEVLFIKIEVILQAPVRMIIRKRIIIEIVIENTFLRWKLGSFQKQSTKWMTIYICMLLGQVSLLLHVDHNIYFNIIYLPKTLRIYCAG